MITGTVKLSRRGDNNHQYHIPDADEPMPRGENYRANGKCENGQPLDCQNIQEIYSGECEHKCKHKNPASQPDLQSEIRYAEHEAPVLNNENGDVEEYHVYVSKSNQKLHKTTLNSLEEI